MEFDKASDFASIKPIGSVSAVFSKESQPPSSRLPSATRLRASTKDSRRRRAAGYIRRTMEGPGHRPAFCGVVALALATIASVYIGRLILQPVEALAVHSRAIIAGGDAADLSSLQPSTRLRDLMSPAESRRLAGVRIGGCRPISCFLRHAPARPLRVFLRECSR